MSGVRPCLWVIVASTVFAGCGRIGYSTTPATDGSMPDTVPGDGGGADTIGPLPRVDGGMDIVVALDGAGDRLPEAPSDREAPRDSKGDTPSPDTLQDTGVDLQPDLPPDADKDVARPTVDYCVNIPYLRATPVIDGAIEPGLTLQTMPATLWSATPRSAGAAFPAGVSTQFAVAWRADSLYFFVRVIDPSRVPASPAHAPYCGDSVEIYVDDNGMSTVAEKYDVSGTRQFVVAAPENDSMSVVRASVGSPSGNSRWTSTQFGAFPIAGGYTIEARIRAVDLGLPTWTLAAGNHVGIDLGTNVSYDTRQPDGCSIAAPQLQGSRLGYYILRLVTPRRYGDERDYPFKTPDAFCVTRLGAP
jgi:hypothetical protein